MNFPRSTAVSVALLFSGVAVINGEQLTKESMDS